MVDRVGAPYRVLLYQPGIRFSLLTNTKVLSLQQPRPLVWQRRQPLPQQVTIGPAPIEGIERTNAVIVRGAGQGAGVPPRRDPFAMEVDRGQNCYACGGFGHMACHCRNRGRGRLMDRRRVEYEGGRIEEIFDQRDNLKGVENLELLD